MEFDFRGVLLADGILVLISLGLIVKDWSMYSFLSIRNLALGNLYLINDDETRIGLLFHLIESL
jgi:hypothetical protein